MAGNDTALLRSFLSVAEPAWKERDLQAVLDKLSKIGVNSLPQLSTSLQIEDGDLSLNALLHASGQRRFTSSTIKKFTGMAGAFNASAMLRVALGSMAGEAVELLLPPDATALELKVRAADLWKLPLACQKAVVGTAVVEDYDLLVKYLPEGATAVPVTIVASLEGVMRDLEEGAGPIRKVTALSVLPQLPASGRRCAAEAAVTHLRDENEDVRRAALHALSRLVPRGDSEALATLLSCATARESALSVKQSAVEALAELALRGDEAVMQLLETALHDASPEMRGSAAQGLVRVALPGDERLLCGLCGLLRDEDETVKSKAIEALVEVTDAGEECVIEALLELVAEPSDKVRLKVMRALRSLALPGDEQTAAAAYDCFLQDGSANVRKAAWLLCQSLHQG